MLAAITTVLPLALLLAGGPGDEDCQACHGDRTARAASGRSIYVDSARHRAGVHSAFACFDCHADARGVPHPSKLQTPACGDCHAEQVAAFEKSVHGPLGQEGCGACHGSVHTIVKAASSGTGSAGKATPASHGATATACAECHADAVTEHRSSVHASRAANGDGAQCASCHGPAHHLLAASDPRAPTAKRNLPQTCGACHSDPAFLARHAIPVAQPVEAYSRSVHARALARGENKAASCSDCHGRHAILPARDPQSKVHHANVAQTCGACHAEVVAAYSDSVHAQALARGARDAPACTDCHGEHAILAPAEPGSPVNPARVSSVTCGHCHGDERLAQRYNLPADKVPSFRDSFHGLAARSGSQSVANCASCHGVHRILPSSDPRSTIHPQNLAATCGHCHPGAGTRFAIGPVHVRPASESAHPLVRFVRQAYLWLIPLTLVFMLAHHGLDFWRKLRHPRPRPDPWPQWPRMALPFRVAHGLVIVSFPVLVVTGFALKFPEAGWAAPLLAFEGQLAARGWLHRVAGLLLMAALLFHLVHVAVSRPGRRLVRGMWPRVRDVRDLWAMLRHNLGRGPRPALGALSYVEKLEYWAFMWGTAVMAVSGLLLWFNTLALRYLPTWALDVATAVHYYEAVLATLSILVWHFYVVIFDPDVYPMDRAWLTGRTAAQHLAHSRPRYAAALGRLVRRRTRAD